MGRERIRGGVMTVHDLEVGIGIILALAVFAYWGTKQ